MLLIYAGLAWLLGMGAGAFLLAPPIIIVAFGIPFARELRAKGILSSNVPIRRYLVSFALLSSLFVILSWAIVHYFPRYFVAFVIGIVFTVLPGLRKCGRNADNMQDFLETNAEFITGDITKALLR
jgi:uncharacterized membrane protein YoaK (UPF0700 family)